MTLRIADYATTPKTGATGSAVRSAYVHQQRSTWPASISWPRNPAEPRAIGSSSTTSTVRSTFSTRRRSSSRTYLDFNGKDGRPGMYQRVRIRDELRQRPDHVPVRPRLRQQRQVLHRPHGEPDATGHAGGSGQHRQLHANAHSRSTRAARHRTTVLVEWTDTNINNATFEGSARELLRMDMVDQYSPDGRHDLQSQRRPRRRRLAD